MNNNSSDHIDLFLKNLVSPTTDPAVWHNLFYAFYVHHFGSFLEAARFLKQTQGLLSQKIARLERDLGYRIFNRTDRGITLTRQGDVLMDALIPYAMNVHGAARQGVREDGMRVVKIVSTNALLSYVILRPLVAFEDAHPGLVKFELVGDDVHLDLVRHDADIVIRPAIEPQPGVVQVPLFTLTKRLYASKS